MTNTTSIYANEIEQLRAVWGTLCLVAEKMKEDEADSFVTEPLAWTDDLIKTAADSLDSLIETLDERLAIAGTEENST